MLPGVEVARRRRVRAAQINDLDAYDGVRGGGGGGGLSRADTHRSRLSVTVSSSHHHHHHHHHHGGNSRHGSSSSSRPGTPRPGSLVRRMQDVLQELHEHRLHSPFVQIGNSSDRVHVIESTTSSHSHSHHSRNSTTSGGSSSNSSSGSGNLFGHHRSGAEFRDGHFASRWRRQASGALSDLRGAALEARNRLDERLRSTARASTNRYPEAVRSNNLAANPRSRDWSIYSSEEDDSIWSDDEGWETSLQEWLAAWSPSVQESWPHWPHWPYMEGAPSPSSGRWNARSGRSFKPKPSQGLSEAAIKALPVEVVGQNGHTGKLEQEDCPVCLEGVLPGQKVILLPCHHRFHPECLTPWLSNHGQCPYCRSEIITDSPTPESRNATTLQDDDDDLSWVEVIERGMDRLNYS